MNQDETGITKLGCVNHDCDQCKAQRTWVGLTYEEKKQIWRSTHELDVAIEMIEAKLKEKNS